MCFAILDRQYGPLGPGPFGGPYSKRGLVLGRDGISYHLADQPGATAQLLASVQNLGVPLIGGGTIAEPDRCRRAIEPTAYSVRGCL